MSGESNLCGGISRRSFLKTTGAIAGASVVGGLACATPGIAEEGAAGRGISDDVQMPSVNCTGNCGGRCFYNACVKDGKMFNIVPHEVPEEEYRQQCQKGMNHLQRVYDPRRIKYPMRRVGQRGSGEWERIGWDEAIDEICTKWKGYQKDFGPTSIVFFPGTGNYRDDAMQYPLRLANYMGACNLNNGYDNNGLFAMTEIWGMGPAVFGNDWRDLKNAKYVFVWGANVTESQPVRWHLLRAAQEAGTKLICIDPNYTIVASKSDQFVSIRPGTDGLLAFAMMKVILDEGLQDEETLLAHTVAPFLVKEDGSYLRLSDLGKADAGAEDDLILALDASGEAVPAATASSPVLDVDQIVGDVRVSSAYHLLVERIEEYAKKYPLSIVSQYTDISEDVITDLAHMFVEGPSTVLTGFGCDHYANGATFYVDTAALSMLSGNIVKPGTGLVGCNVSFPIGLGSDYSAILNPPDAPGAVPMFASYFPEVVQSGKWGPFDVVPKSLYVWIGNPMGNQPDHELWKKTMQDVEFVVLADVYMTETANYADMLLPVPHYFELESFFGSNTYMRHNEAAIEPQFESKGDLEIINLIGQGMGFEKEFSLTREDFNRSCFENPTAAAMNLSWERIKEEKAVKAYPDLPVPYVHGMAGFMSATGKAEFYRENSRPIPDFGQTDWDQKEQSLPWWEPPHEAWMENELFEKYPLVFTTERGKFKVHTQWSYAETFSEVLPEPVVKLSSDDAQARGIESGDVVKLFNDRGYVVCKAAVNPGTRKGVVIMDHGWQEDQFIEGHYNSLTSVYTHPRYPAGCFFDSLVDIEKVD